MRHSFPERFQRDQQDEFAVSVSSGDFAFVKDSYLGTFLRWKKMQISQVDEDDVLCDLPMALPGSSSQYVRDGEEQLCKEEVSE